ncbi:MAG TPA: M1 family metallopeptidase [Puia sp.]|nr:M1 family metallopeptidase [Puia sp.]
MTSRQFFSCLLLCGYLAILSGAAGAQSVAYGGKLKPEQANMDILHYTISLTVNIPDKRIDGYTIIGLTIKQPTTVLLFDLMDSMVVSKVWVNGMQNAFTHTDHLLRLSNTASWPAGQATVKVQYGGHPTIAKRPPWDDGFTFTKDSTGTDWVAITAEGTGGKLYFPCKDHPSDEPDNGVDLFVKVPRGLSVAGPGLLKGTETKGSSSTFHWKTMYPINNYSIVFNIGNYEVVTSEYTTVNGNKVPMQFYVLKAHKAQAAHLLEMMKKSARVKEKYFGEYPWVKEKIGLVETPHLGMEHQTMIAYGNGFHYSAVGGMDFDWLMNHEFGHEWWGNKVTAGDWADYWIHEGIGSFGDDLYVRDMEGEDSYEKIFQRSVNRIKNDKPVVLGKDIEEEAAYHDDIYSKGAFFMHTLRYVIGDAVFFPTLKKLATDSNYTYTHTVNTDDVQKLFSDASATDLAPLFNLYLRTIQKLEVQVKQLDSAKYRVQLVNIDMPLPFDVTTDKGTTRMMLSKKGEIINSKTLPVLDSRVFYLKKVVYE